MAQIPRFVLTGGPCGGKSTLIEELRRTDQRWLFVPESAPLLIHGGLSPRERSFQIAVVRLQVALEEAVALAAAPDRCLLCHRGTLDALAYWRQRGWPEVEFFAATGMTAEQHGARYSAVLHLQTTAIDAVDHYRRWPLDQRHETLDQAAEVDRLCEAAWSRHPRHAVLGNRDRTWPEKARLAREWLTRGLAP